MKTHRITALYRRAAKLADVSGTRARRSHHEAARILAAARRLECLRTQEESA